MSIQEKLRFIQNLSGLPQEELARKLGVSFPTLNSWINGKSNPRKEAEARIKALFVSYTGQKQLSEEPVSARKQLILEKRKRYPNVLQLIQKRPDLHDQFLLSLTYNTNRIEGSSLTEDETAAILFDNVALRNKTITEQLEVKNHQSALEFLLSCVTKRTVFDEVFILKLHSMLMNGIRQDAGAYRQQGVRIVGSNVPTANYMKVPILMKALIKEIGKATEDVITHVSRIHSRFEQIHPFSDGNGRIGRLLIHAMLLRKDYPPAVIKQQRKRIYISSLNKAQLKNNFNDLEEFICDAVLESYKVIEKSE